MDNRYLEQLRWDFAEELYNIYGEDANWKS